MRLMRDPSLILRAPNYIFGRTLKDPAAARTSKWSFGKLQRVQITRIFPDIKNADVRVLGAFNRKIDMSIDAYEILCIVAIASHIKPKSVLEIGTFDGGTTLNLAANTPDDAIITTVDLPSDYCSLKLLCPGQYAKPPERNEIATRYKNTPYEKKIRQIYCDSASLEYSDFHIDLAFIDGCHRYAYVKNDTDSILSRMNPGGIVIWHDYGMISEVSKLVDEVSDRIPISIIQNTRLAVGRV